MSENQRSSRAAVSYAATEQFVENKIAKVVDDIPEPSANKPLLAGVASAGSGTAYSCADHVHPGETQVVDSQAQYALPHDCFPISIWDGTKYVPRVFDNSELEFSLYDASYIVATIKDGGAIVGAFWKSTLYFYGPSEMRSVIRYNGEQATNNVWPKIITTGVYVRNVRVAKDADVKDISDKLDKIVPYDDKPVIAGTADSGSSDAYSRGDHVHPGETSFAEYALPDECFPISVWDGTQYVPCVFDNSELEFSLLTVNLIQATIKGSESSVGTFLKGSLYFQGSSEMRALLRYNGEEATNGVWPVLGHNVVKVRDVRVPVMSDLGTAAYKNVGTTANDVAAGDSVRIVEYSIPDDCFPIRYTYNGFIQEVVRSNDQLRFVVDDTRCEVYETFFNDVISVFDLSTLKWSGQGSSKVANLTFTKDDVDTEPESGVWPVLEHNTVFVRDIQVATTAFVQDALSYTSTTWSGLVNLRDTGKLIPGAQYRITDYSATVKDNYARAAEGTGHPFDLLVTADSTNKVNEVARAVRHEGDTYFPASTKFEAWRVWYCLDNDRNRFYWAYDDSSFETFNGVTFVRDASNDVSGAIAPYCWAQSGESATKRYTFSQAPVVGSFCCSTSSGALSSKILAVSLGKGVIYRLIDEFNNDLPYDFKGIQVSSPKEAGKNPEPPYRYTFGNDTDDSDSDAEMQDLSLYGKTNSIYNNKIDNGDDNKHLPSIGFRGGEIYDNVFTGGSGGLSFKGPCTANTISAFIRSVFAADCHSNTIVGGRDSTFGDHFSRNKVASINGCSFGEMITKCSFGGGVETIHFATIGNNVNAVVVGGNTRGVTIGDNCYHITVGDSCNFASIGKKCSAINIGFASNYVSIGESCSEIETGSKCRDTNIGSSCSGITVGANSTNNRIFSHSKNISVGLGCEGNIIGEIVDNGADDESSDSSDSDVILDIYMQNITLENGVSNITLRPTGSTSQNAYYQNVTLASGLKGAVIVDPNVGQTFHTTYQPANSRTIEVPVS